MIDTLHVSFHTELDVNELDGKWMKTTSEWKDVFLQKKTRVSYKRKIYIGSSLVFLKYHTLDYTGEPLFDVEISSMPKVLGFPDGYLLADISPVVDKVNEELRSLSGIPKEINLWNGNILRIDFCFQFSLGANIDSYIDVISHLNYPHRTRGVYANDPKKGIDNGVWFYSKSCLCKFYDKGMESSARKLQGILRMETSLSKPNAITRAFGSVLTPPKLREVTNDMLKAVLLKDLHVLGLDLPYILDIDGAFERLKSIYGAKQALVLRDTLEAMHSCTEFSINKIAKVLGVKKSTVYSRIKDIKNAGMVPALNMAGKRLMPLSQFLVSDLFPEKQQKSVVIPRNESVDHSTSYLRPGAF